MDIERTRAEKLHEIQSIGRQRAVKEIIDLKARHHGSAGLVYTFEFNGKILKGVFVTASLQQNPPNAYEIVVLTASDVVVHGQAYITDTQGRRIGASAKTVQGKPDNRVTLETLAVP